MYFMFAIVFIDLVGFGVIIPLLPFYAEHFDASPDMVGLLMATYSLTQFIAAPVWGRLSDRHGRRPILLISLAGTAASYVLLAYADTLILLFVARAVGGFLAGNISVAFAYMADVTSPANRAKGMGLVGAAFGLGFIFGPAIGGVLAGPDPLIADFRTPSLVAAGLSGVALLLAFFRLSESLSPALRASLAAMPRTDRRRAFIDALKHPMLPVYLFMLFLSTFVFAGMEATFAMFTERQFGWGPRQNGYLFAGVGVVAAAMQGGLVGRLARAFGEHKLVIAGAFMLSCGLFLLAQASQLPALIIAMLVLAVGFSLLQPALNSLVSQATPEGGQGGVMGVARSVSTLARVVGPAWAGILFAGWGRHSPYFLGGVLMLVVLLIAFRVRHSENKTG